MTQKILLVEDDKEIREIYQLKFKLSGYDIDVAEDGAKAMKMIKEIKPDLVLLDILLPYKDGFEILREVKNMDDVEMKSIEFVMLSNLSNDDDIQEAKKLGAIDYIVKAKNNPREIVEKVEIILKNIVDKHSL
ncbi:response regulator [Candidatus Parcubacteria bacterium]|nr:response regulator [Candidatus Parcubacteria bacterium]